MHAFLLSRLLNVRSIDCTVLELSNEMQDYLSVLLNLLYISVYKSGLFAL